jgi:hypothetical protein
MMSISFLAGCAGVGVDAVAVLQAEHVEHGLGVQALAGLAADELQSFPP